MTENRVERALTRLESALQRIAAARPKDAAENEASQKDTPQKDNGSSARIMALVNSHEKLREEIADALGDLDTLIEELEGADPQ